MHMLSAMEVFRLAWSNWIEIWTMQGGFIDFSCINLILINRNHISTNGFEDFTLNKNRCWMAR